MIHTLKLASDSQLPTRQLRWRLRENKSACVTVSPPIAGVFVLALIDVKTL